jgi:hypothetical protein
MQNRYVGDVGDFAKYGLLRLLISEGVFKLGLVWCLFGDENHNSDGRHISYLQSDEFRALDPSLHDKLSRIVQSGRRSVNSISQARILPPSTTYFSSSISSPNSQGGSSPERIAYRNKWLSSAFDSTAACDLVFFDPDNGVETASVLRHAPKAGKYIFWNELVPFWQRGQSIIVYHHLNRTASVQRQTEILREKFSANFPDAAVSLHFLFRRGSCRHFWLVGQRDHFSWLSAGTRRVKKSGWSGFFEIG